MSWQSHESAKARMAKDSNSDKQPLPGRKLKTKKSAEEKAVRPASPIDPGLYCLVNIAGFHGVAADPAQIAHVLALEGVASEDDLVLAGRQLGFKTRATTVRIDTLAKLPLPAIVGWGDDGFALLAQVVDDKYLMLLAADAAPKVVSQAEFQRQWNGRVILYAQRFWREAQRKFDIKWFIPTIIKYKKPLLEVLAAAFMLQVLGIFAPILTQVVIDKALVHHSTSTLDVIVTGLVIVAVFEAIMGIARSYIFTHTTSRIDVILGSRLYRHLFALPLRYFETRRVGDTTARIMELEKIRQFLAGTPLTTLLDVLFIAVYIVVMFVYSPTLSWVVLGTLPFFVVLSAVVTPLFRHRLDERFDAGADSQSYLVESVSGAQTIKSFALEPQMQKLWENKLATYTRTSYKTAILSGNASALGQLIQKISDLAILWFGAHLVMAGSLTIGALIAFRMLSSRVSGPVLRLVQSWQDFQQTGISIKRLGDIFNSAPEPGTDPSKSRLPAIRGDIRFEKVRFRYRPDAAEVIRDISFGIRPGKVVGIVGRSGSGKSTIGKLIQRLYIPETGKILIDGVDISLTDASWLRRQVGVVLQENFLFNASIRDNIAVHMPSASIEDVVRVAQVAGAHEFILDLPEGYDTMVGEKGEGLSGGQKQRIAIARALLHDPRILIFDEATSALDYESENIIQQNLRQICAGRTVIIIAHRLSTLRDVDLVMAIDRGQVVEYGKPEVLLAKNGLYAHLHKQQLGGE